MRLENLVKVPPKHRKLAQFMKNIKCETETVLKKNYFMKWKHFEMTFTDDKTKNSLVTEECSVLGLMFWTLVNLN